MGEFRLQTHTRASWWSWILRENFSSSVQHQVLRPAIFLQFFEMMGSFFIHACCEVLWSSAIPGLWSGSLTKLLTLPSFPVLPLPTHHEKISKLNVNLTDTFKVKNSFTALSSLWVPAFTWTLGFEDSLISFPFTGAFKHILKAIQSFYLFLLETQVPPVCFFDVFIA